ncbi:MAG: hypothetical protein K8R23_07710 [Chthoniobacter sp.]|nr:hypothetical protein [Chthoniobacter sp.]
MPGGSGAASTPSANARANPGSTGTKAKNPSGTETANPIETLFGKLQEGTATEADLDALKRALLADDPALATAAIREFLATGRDTRTGFDFALRPGGELTAPTLRVLLMDVLGRIAKRDGTDGAAKLARETLEKKDSADEWAIALRNVAWHEPAATAYLTSKAREMLAYEPWRASPSSGMLEAFDVIVFTKNASLTADLASAQRDPNEQIQHAADVALDRLAAANPLDVMNYLNANPVLLAERPMLRADYFAKADLGAAGQKNALEFYLGRTDIAAAEKAKLLKALATPATFVSENLLTEPPPEPDEALREHAILAAVHEWLVGKRFPSLDSQLLDLQRRLARE